MLWHSFLTPVVFFVLCFLLLTLEALGAARIPIVTCTFRQPFRSSPVVRSLPLHYTTHLPSEPRDTVPTPQSQGKELYPLAKAACMV